MRRAIYDFSFDENEKILMIEDLFNKFPNSLIPTVTNDMDNILYEMSLIVNLNKYKIIYKDSTGIWDGIEYNSGNFSFYSINETDLTTAKLKLLFK